MTKSELITEIGYRYRSASRNFVTADEIVAELNRSIDRLSGIVNLEDSITTSTISFTANGTYTFTSLSITDFKEPVALYDPNNLLKFKRMSSEGLVQAQPSSTGAAYPQYSVTSTGITIYSPAYPATLTLSYYSTNDSANVSGTWRKGLSANTDYPLLQARYHDYFVEDVAAKLYRKERKYDDFKIAKQEAKDILADIFADNPDRRETIVFTATPYQETYS